MIRTKLTERLMAPAGEENEGGASTAEVKVEEVKETPKPDVSAELERLQRDRDRREREMRLKHEKETEKLKSDLEKAKKERDEVVSTLSVNKAKTSADGQEDRNVDAVLVRMDLLERRHEQEKTELLLKLEASERSRAEIEKLHKETERKRSLRDAIDMVGVTNRSLAERFFAPQVVEDELDGGWVYKTSDGRIVPIKEGIELEIPSELKTSILKGSGTGVTGTAGGSKSKLQREFDENEQEMSNIQQQIRSRRGADNAALLVRFDQLKRKKNELHAQMKKAK